MTGIRLSMSAKLLRLLVVSLFLLLYGAESVEACSCKSNLNPCAAFRSEGGVIFTGTVSEVFYSSEKYGKPIGGKVRAISIRVDEIFKGELPAQVLTSDDGFSCDNFPFAIGKSYLIYAGGVEENSNIVKVGLCSGTRLLEKADEHLRFLRPLKDGRTFSTIFGTVWKFINTADLPNEPLGKTKVVLVKEFAIENGQYKKPKKKDRERSSITDEQGNYNFYDIPAGRYKMRAELPTGLWVQESREFGSGGVSPLCENHSFLAMPDGQVSGKVLSAEQMPVAHLKLTLQPLRKTSKFYQYLAQTDALGNYVFYGVPEGDYKLSIRLAEYKPNSRVPEVFTLNFPYTTWYFPGTIDEKSATVVSVKPTEKVSNIDIVMRQFPVTRKVMGVVTQEVAPQLANIHVMYKIKGLHWDYWRYVPVKADGSFSFDIFEEFDYLIQATAYDSKSSRSFLTDEVTLTESNRSEPLSLTLKPQR